MLKLVPPHGWRAVWWELGIVTLGVLIALGIGEIAEAVRWKVRVNSSMAAMRTELSENHFNVVERRAYQQCLVNRLSQIGQVLRDARRSGILPHIDKVGGPALRLTQSSAFEVAKSEGVLLHMDKKQARDFASIYGVFELYRTLADEEQNSWQFRQIVQATPGPISDDILAGLLEAWASAMTKNHWMGILAQQQDDELDRLGVNVAYEPQEPNRKAVIKRLRGLPVCAPLRVNGKPKILG